MTYPMNGGLVDERGRTRLVFALFSAFTLLLFPAHAQGQGTPLPATTKRRGAWTTHVWTLPGTPPKQAWLSRGGTEKVRLVVDGQELRLRTRRYLVPGEYQLLLDQKPRAAQLGSPKQIADAKARMDAWFQNAHDAFRELAMTLERRGSFHSGLREQKRDARVGAFRNSFLGESWKPALLSARMDLTLFEQRLLLPPRPEALAALKALADALAARRAAWETCLYKQNPLPGAATKVEAGAKALLQALGKNGAPLGWGAGPLGTPPPAASAGAKHVDPLGFELEVPTGAEIKPCTDPVDRLILKLDNTLLVVRVLEFPGVKDPAELRARLERDAFERWTAYKQLSATPSPEGDLRLEFTARLAVRSTKGGVQGNAQVVQWARLPQGGERALLVIAIRPEGKPIAAPATAILKGLDWKGGGQ